MRTCPPPCSVQDGKSARDANAVVYIPSNPGRHGLGRFGRQPANGASNHAAPIAGSVSPRPRRVQDRAVQTVARRVARRAHVVLEKDPPRSVHRP
eukprot:1188936-Prorocentrum_minimum.AAC.2